MKLAVARSRRRWGDIVHCGYARHPEPTARTQRLDDATIHHFDVPTSRRLPRPLTRFAFTLAERDAQSQDDAVDVVEVADALGEIEDRAIVKPGIT